VNRFKILSLYNCTKDYTNQWRCSWKYWMDDKGLCQVNGNNQVTITKIRLKLLNSSVFDEKVAMLDSFT